MIINRKRKTNNGTAGRSSTKGLPSCKSFFDDYPRFKNAFGNIGAAKRLFDFIISREPEIIDAALNKEQPALCGLLPYLERKFHNPSAGLDFEHNIFLRQFIGTIVGDIMKRRNFVKVGSRNISHKISEFFSAAALYRPVEWVVRSGNKVALSQFFIPDYESQKKNAHKFAAAEKFKEKILSIISPGSDMMIFKRRDCLLASTKDLADLAPDRDATDDYFENYRMDSVFFCAAQIAVELELRYPGIIAASGLKFASIQYDRQSDSARRHYFFVELIEEILETMAEKANCEKRKIIDWFAPILICSYNHRDYMIKATGSGLPIYRLKPVNLRTSRNETTKINTKIFSDLKAVRETESSVCVFENMVPVGARREFFLNLQECILASLKNARTGLNAEKTAPLVSSCQLAISVAELQMSPNYVFPLKLIEREFFHKTFENPSHFGEDERVFTAGLSLRHIAYSSFSYDSDFERTIEPPGRFIPLAAIE